MFIEIWCLLLGGFMVAVVAFSLGFLLMGCCALAGQCSDAERRRG